MTFTLGGTTWQPSRNPLRPEHQPSANQAMARTAGGVVYGYDPVVTVDRFTLQWPFLADSDVSTLWSFFTNTAQGMANDFTYTDVDAVSLTVRFAEPSIEMVDRANGGKAVKLTLQRTL